MPGENDHHEQALNNVLFFQSFDLPSTPFRDWAVTALFYSALHFVDAYLATCNAPIAGRPPLLTGGHHPNSHFDRDQKVANEPFLSEIWNEYRAQRALNRRALSAASLRPGPHRVALQRRIREDPAPRRSCSLSYLTSVARRARRSSINACVTARRLIASRDWLN